MKKSEKTIIRRRLINAYLSSLVSISLVLVLVGVAVVLLVNARTVSDYFKENLQISVLFKQEVSEKKAEAHLAEVLAKPYVKEGRLVTREEGENELKQMLGEDFLSVFEASPVPISLEICLEAEYVSPDSLALVLPQLQASPLVDEVECQQSLVEALNANMAKISLILGVFILLMLFISFVLINNTVRLNMYARRFTIHTMKLVGATRGFICAPFLKAAVIQGLLSSAFTIMILGALLALLKKSFAELYGIFTVDGMIQTALIIVLCGVLISVVCTYMVVTRLLRLDKDDLYY